MQIRVIPVKQFKQLEAIALVCRRRTKAFVNMSDNKLQELLALLDEYDKQPDEQFEFEQPYADRTVDQKLLGSWYFSNWWVAHHAAKELLAEREMFAILNS